MNTTINTAVAILNQRELALLKQHGVDQFNRAQRGFWAEYDHGRYTPESLAPVAGELRGIAAQRAVLLGTAD